MATLLTPHATEHPDAPAIVDAIGTVTWTDLNERVNRLVNALRTRGLQVGDTIVVMAGNQRETYEVTLAAIHGGWTVVPVNWPTWTMWQYTDGAVGPDPHQVAGIGHCDRDKFNGSEDQLRTLWLTT